MGRMLDALRRVVPDEAGPVLVREEPRAAHDDDAECEIPFIEIGARGTPVQASPGVLAAGPNIHSPGPPRIAATPHAAPPVIELRAVRSTAPDAEEDSSGISPALVAFHEPSHNYSKAYRSLWQELATGAAQEHSQRLLFTAAKAGVGATTVLLNLAITAARLGEGDVAVVDANFAKPDVSGRLGVADTPGLAEVLTGRCVLDQALAETAQAGLFVLPAGRCATAPGLSKATGVLQRLRERFAVVLLDAPLAGDQQGLALAEGCDAVFLILSRTEEQEPGTRNLLRSIRRHTTRLAGMILT